MNRKELIRYVILFAAGRTEVMKRFLVEEGAGNERGSGGWPRHYRLYIRPVPRKSVGWMRCWLERKDWVFIVEVKLP